MNKEKQEPALTESEEFAKKILDALGWEPEKIHPTKNSDDIGMPDFKCSENRYVEIKQGHPSKQIQVWANLTKEGKKVYLMNVIKKKNGYTYKFYKVKFWLEEVKDIKSLEKLTCRVCGAKVDWLHHGDLCDKCSETWEVRESNFEVW